MNYPATTPVARRSLSPTPRTSKWTHRTGLRWNFAEWFILSQTIFPALLYLPGTQPLRIVIRVAAYGISLAALVYYWSSIKSRTQVLLRLHPSAPWLLGVVVYLGIMLAHPHTNSLLSGVAQICLYIAILAPVLWVPACVNAPRRVNRLLWLLLICNGINSFVGVMQVHDPEHWMPKDFASNFMDSEFGLGTVIYEGANGNMLIRPPGLGDTPGAVSGPGVFALYLGLVFVVTERAWWKKILAVCFALVGAQAIFLSLVRSSFLIAVAMLVLFLLIQVTRARFVQAVALILVAVTAIILAFLLSSSSGGETLYNRFHSLVEQDPTEFYYENRGSQVAEGFGELLPKFPLGAGLGRYGMMNAYFGNQANAAAAPIWVEIQWPAWIVDGGLIILLLYPAAIVVAMWQQFRATYFGDTEEERQVGSIILAANAGMLMLCFSYAVFLSPLGIQFWFLAGALYGAFNRNPDRSRRGSRRAVRPVRPAEVAGASAARDAGPIVKGLPV